MWPNRPIFKEFKKKIAQENIMRVLKDEPLCKPVFYTSGPNENYRRPWRMIINDATDRNVAIICATCDDWLDIVAKDIPTNIAREIVEEINNG